MTKHELAKSTCTTVPAAPADSRDSRDSVNELLVAICKEIFGRVVPVVAGTLKQGSTAELAPIDKGLMWLRVTPEKVQSLLGSGPVEAELVAAVALFPPGERALLAARVDAKIRVSHSGDTLAVSITQCNKREFLLSELSEPFEATDALHLVFDSATDTGYTFVLVEFTTGNFTAKGWLEGEIAAQYAAEGAKRAEGRLPDFRGTVGKWPR